MVFITAKGITLIIDNSFSIRFDSSMLLTDRSNQIFLVIARLDDDAFFLNISANYLESDCLTSWDINPIVKPLISQITIRPELEMTPKRFTTNIRVIRVEDGLNQPYLIALTPGKSENITNDIVVHLLSRTLYHDDASSNAREVSSEWIFADRYHMVSPWSASSATAIPVDRAQVVHDNMNVHSSTNQQNRNLLNGNSMQVMQRESSHILHRGTSPKAVDFTKDRKNISHLSRKKYHNGDECTDLLSLKVHPDRDTPIATDGLKQDLSQSHWLSSLSGSVWNALTGLSLLHPLTTALRRQ